MTIAPKSAKTTATDKPKRRAPSTAWKKGQSGNPAGRPATGESWAELIKKIGDMSPKQAAEHCKAIAGQLAPIGDAVTLKEAVVMRVYAALLFEPQAGLLNSVMERAEGKVADKVEVYDWRKDPELLKAGIDPEELVKDLFAKVSTGKHD